MALALSAGLLARATGLVALVREGGAPAVTGPRRVREGGAPAVTGPRPARVQVVDPRATDELRARGRSTGVVNAACRLSGVQDAVQRDADAVDEPAPADHVARTSRFTNPGTDE
jgi:hypothetical protein